MPAAMAGRTYPFPFRTRKSSAPAPMILPTGGKVGRRRLSSFSLYVPSIGGDFLLPGGRQPVCLRIRNPQASGAFFPFLALVSFPPAGIACCFPDFAFPCFSFYAVDGRKISMCSPSLVFYKLATNFCPFDRMACSMLFVRAVWRFRPLSPFFYFPLSCCLLPLLSFSLLKF